MFVAAWGFTITFYRPAALGLFSDPCCAAGRMTFAAVVIITLLGFVSPDAAQPVGLKSQ